MLVLKWPGNYPDLNPIKDVRKAMKTKIQEAQPSNINEPKNSETLMGYHGHRKF